MSQGFDDARKIQTSHSLEWVRCFECAVRIERVRSEPSLCIEHMKDEYMEGVGNEGLRSQL